MTKNIFATKCPSCKLSAARTSDQESITISDQWIYACRWSMFW